MSNFVVDSFTGTNGTNLSAHTGETGASWSYGTLSANPIQLSGAGRVYGTSLFQNSVILASGTPLSADYTVSAVFHYFSSISSYEIGLIARCDGTHWYGAEYDSDQNRWLITYDLTIVAELSQSLVAGADYFVQLSCTGTTIAMRVNGVEILSVTDARITAAGQAGIHCQSPATGSTGVHVGDFSAGPTPAAFYPDNSAFRYFGFFQSGVGASSLAQTDNTGSYALVNFTGTSAALFFDTSTLSGLNPIYMPYVEYRVDGGLWSSISLSPTNCVLRDIDGLADTTHRLEIVASGPSDQNQFTDATPEFCVRLIGMQVDAGKVLSAPSLRPGRGLIYGDSIVSNQVETFEAQYNWPYLLHELMDAEILPVGYSGQGYYPKNYSNGGANSSMIDTWDHYNSTHSRLSGGHYIERVDWIFIEQGKNNSSLDPANVQAQIEAIRAVFTGPIIVNLGAFDGTSNTEITAGVAAYQSAHPSDSRVFGLDDAPMTFEKIDGTHPTIAGCVTIADTLAPLLLSLIPATSGQVVTALGSPGIRGGTQLGAPGLSA